MTDIGSDISNALNGLNTVVADDLETDSLEVSGVASIGTLNVSGNTTIAQDLTVYGNYFGPAITSNTGTYAFLTAGTGTITNLSSTNFNFSNLSGPTGYIGSLTSNEVRTPLIYNPTGGYLVVGNSTTNDVVELKASTVQADADFYVGRLNNRSRMVMNSNSNVGSTGAGIYVRDDPGGGSVFSLAKMSAVSSDRLAYQYSTPANQKMTVEMRPKTVSVNTTSQIILSDPASSSQTINSDVQINGNLGVSGTISGSFGTISANTGSFNYLSAGTGSISSLSSTTGSITNLSSTNISFTNTISGPTGSFSYVESDQVFFKPPLEPGVGNWTTLNRSDAKILYYDGGASNWAGEGVDAGGNWWRRTGVGTQHTLLQLESGGVGIDVLPSNMSSKLQVAGEVCTESGVGGYAYKDRTSGTKNFITLSDGDVLTTANYGVEPLTTLSRGPGELWVKGKISAPGGVTGSTGSFTNLGFTNGSGTNLTVSSMTGTTINTTNLTATNGGITNLTSTSATITGSTYNPIPGNITSAWAMNAGTSFISYDGICESSDNSTWVLAYGSVGCNGTAQSIQLHKLDGTLSSTYLNVPTTCTTSMAFAVLYDKKTGSPSATFRIPRTTSGGAGFLDAKFSPDNTVYLVGYFNNTVSGQSYETWNNTTVALTIPTSSAQIPVVIALNADDQSWIQTFPILPNGAFSTLDKVAVETDGQVVVAGQYIHTGSNLTIGPFSIPASTTKVPFMVYLSMDQLGTTVRNMWWAFNNQAVTCYLKDLTFVGTGAIKDLYLYIGITSPGAYNLTDFATASPATVRGTIVDTSGGNFPFILRWQRSLSPYLFGLQSVGRAYVNSKLASAIFNGNAGRMVYNPVNNTLYFTGRVQTFSTSNNYNFCIETITFSSTGAPFRSLKTAFNASESAGFLGAFDMATNTLIGISPLVVESPLYTTRGEVNNWMGALYVDTLGNTYINGRIHFNNVSSNNSQDTPIDLSIRLRTNSRFVLRDIGTTECVSSFILKFDSTDRLVGWSQLKVQSTDTAFAVNGFATTLYGNKLIALCANPVATSDITNKALNFNDTWSGIVLPSAVTPPKTMGMSYDIGVISQTVIGDGGISVGWNTPLSSATDALYQRVEGAQIKTSGSIVSGTSLVTPSIYSLNKTEPNNGSNIIPTLQIQPQGGRVNIGGGDLEMSQVGNKLSINGLASSTQINTTRPFQRFGQGFSDCLYYWFGGDNETISTSAEVYQRQFLAGGASNNTTYWTNRWSVSLTFMFFIQGLVRDDTAFPTENVYNPSAPIQYVGWRVPVDSRCDNAFFMATMARNVWTSVRVWLCNFASGVPTVLLGEDSTSSKEVIGSDAGRQSSFLGPFNTGSKGWTSANNEWLQFNIPQIYLDESLYCQGGEVKIAIQPRYGSDSVSELYIGGIATAPNPLSIMQRRAVSLHWRLMGIWATNYFTDGNGNYQEEWYSHWSAANKIVQFYIPIGEVPTTTDWILTMIGHGNSWEQPRLKLVDAFGDEENLLFRRGGGPSCREIQGSGIYRNSWHCYISKAQMDRMFVTFTNNTWLYSIRMRVSPPGWTAETGLWTRGFIIERAYPHTTLE